MARAPLPSLLLAAAMLMLSSHPVAGQPSLKIAAPPASDPGLRLAGVVERPVLRVGEAVPLELDTAQGEWQVHGDGSATWSLRIDTEDATHIGLMLQDARLPEGAELFMEQRDTASPRWSRARRDASGRSWLPAQPGDRMTLHIILPDATRMPEVHLGTGELLYGTHDVSGRASQVGTSGGCHNNVVCPQGDAWDDPVRATARILIGGRLLCNAVLVNNTRNDGRPLMLTAEHCGIGNESERFPAESVTALFNFQSTSCGSNQGFSTSDTLQGERLLFRHAESDVALFELESPPPASFNAVYAGWDATGDSVASGAGIHHPSGDLKKVSLFDEALDKRRIVLSRGGVLTGEEQQVESWRVIWADGTTEPGSSGSGLWDPQRRTVGVLSGGQSECAPRNGGGLLGGLIGGGSQPPDNFGPDFYGRLEVAWNASGRLGTPLRDFLDPAGNSGRVADARGTAARPPGGDNASESMPSGSGSGATDWLLIAGLGLIAVSRLRRRPVR